MVSFFPIPQLALIPVYRERIERRVFFWVEFIFVCDYVAKCGGCRMEEIMKDKINFFFFHLTPWNVSKNGILHTNICHLLLNYPKHKKTRTECSNFSDEWITQCDPAQLGRSFIRTYFRKWINEPHHVKKLNQTLHCYNCIFNCTM